MTDGFGSLYQYVVVNLLLLNRPHDIPRSQCYLEQNTKLRQIPKDRPPIQKTEYENSWSLKYKFPQMFSHSEHFLSTRYNFALW